MTPFERELQRQPFRSLPPEWRDGILGKAKNPVAFHSSSGWHDWLWPSPVAWAAVAAVWLLFLSLDTVDRELSKGASTQVIKAEQDRALQRLDRVDPSLLFTWRDRDRLLANLN